MIKAILLLLVFVIFSIGAFWLSQNSGSLTFEVFGYYIETSFILALAVLIISFFLLLIFFRLLGTILHLPQDFKHLLSSLYKIDPVTKFEEILVAIHNHDYSKAKKILNLLKKHKFPENLVNILASEVSMLKEDIGEIKSALINLSNSENTKISGYEGLVSLALKEGNLNDAINYCEELSKIHQSEWLLSIILNTYMQAERWNNIIDFIQNSKTASLLNKSQKYQLSAVANYKLANNAYLAQDYELALQLATTSYKDFPDFIPTLALLAHISLQQSSTSNAIKYLKHAWELNPCFSLSEIVAAIIENHPAEKALSITKNIASYNPKHYESYLIVARAALDKGKYEEASDAISGALEGTTKFRACLIMAEYCQKTHGNIAETISWLKRAISSEIDLNHCLFFWDFDTMTISQNSSVSSITIAMI